MKFNKLSQLFLVSAIGLSVAALLTSCAINTIDYVFVADSAGSGSGSAGQIQTYDVGLRHRSTAHRAAYRVPAAATTPSPWPFPGTIPTSTSSTRAATTSCTSP